MNFPKSQKKSLSKSSLKLLEKEEWQKHANRQAALLYPAYLINRILNVELTDFHNEWLNFTIARDRSLILAPRGHGKTTILTIGYTLWRILSDPNSRVLIVCNTQAQADSFLREIKQHLELNPFVTTLFGTQRGPKWTDRDIVVKRSNRFGKESTVSAMGVETAIISRHFDLVILDDVVDEENARTAIQRDRLRTWYYTTLAPTLEPHGELHIMGTRYHSRDLYGYLIEGPFNRNFTRYRALDENDKPLWPEKFSREFLSRARDEAGPIIFNAQYQNDVELMRGNIFRQEWIKRYYRAPDTMKIAIGVDLAIGQKEVNDYFAIVVVGRDGDGNLHVLEARRGRFTFEEQFDKIVDTYKRFNGPLTPVVRVGVEATAYQEALPQRLKRETSMPVVSVRPAVDKLSRAHALTAFFESERIFFRDDATQSALIEELLLFPDGDHDDLFDALEIAVNLAAEAAGYRDIFKTRSPDLAPVG